MTTYKIPVEMIEQDIDDRSLLLPANEIAIKSDRGEHLVNGLVALSRVGLHAFVVGRYSDFTWGRPYSTIRSWHFPLRDLMILDASCSATGYLPAGRRTFRLIFGYQELGGRIGPLLDELQKVGTRKTRATFLDAVAEVRKSAAPFPEGVHPLLARMDYFADASIVGGALLYADLALKFAELQPIIRRGPGLFERGELKQNGWRGNAQQYPVLTGEDVTRVKRRRAWMLLEAGRDKTLLDERKNKPDGDAIVTLAYGVALARDPKRAAEAPNYLLQPRTRAPESAGTQAGAAWGLALQRRTAEAEQAIDGATAAAHGDQYALLLLGCAEQAAGRPAAALEHYIASAALSHGYFEGTLACRRAANLAIELGPEALSATVKRLSEVAPLHPEPWIALMRVSEATGDQELARAARARITAMAEG